MDRNVSHSIATELPHELETERLRLELVSAADIPALVVLLDNLDVARTLVGVPHPFERRCALEFIARSARAAAFGSGFAFSIFKNTDNAFIGGCDITLQGQEAEFGYWLGKPFWGQGYATEAARQLVAFAFHDLHLSRLTAAWFHDNPASGRILEKLGGTPAGSMLRFSVARDHLVQCHRVELYPESAVNDRVS